MRIKIAQKPIYGFVDNLINLHFIDIVLFYNINNFAQLFMRIKPILLLIIRSPQNPKAKRKTRKKQQCFLVFHSPIPFLR